jgi:beta-glucosidase
VLPFQKGKTVYIPKRFTPASKDWFGRETPEKLEYPVNMDVVKKYFNVTDDPLKADYAIVFVNSPNGGVGYSKEDRATSNGYVPISLQYGPYTAEYAREKSMAAGDPVIDSTITNRTYQGKTVTATNVSELKTILDTKAAMQGKPVVVAINISKPMVFAEFEKQADGIVGGFGVQDQAMLDIITGAAEPLGLLPVQMPANMKTVEQQAEDVPYDMECHVDSEGHVYDFGYGLNWKGVINDARTAKYKKTTAQQKQSKP